MATTESSAAAQSPASDVSPQFSPRFAFGVVLLIGLVALNVYGASYYLAPLAQRLRHPQRALFKPSGTIGQSLGLFALALFLFLWLYPLRKRVRALAFTGAVARWLDVHIVAGLFVPLVAAMHASWRFTGLIGLGYLAMFLVALSGIVGRYLYTRIPRSRGGLELGREELAAERRRLVGEISAATGLVPAEVERALAPTPWTGGKSGIVAALRRMVADDIERRRAIRALVRRLGTHEIEARDGVVAATLARGTPRRIARLARREMALAQQVRMLDAIQGVFRFWHTAHRPFAVMALLAVLVHVGVAIAVGQTWFR